MKMIFNHKFSFNITKPQLILGFCFLFLLTLPSHSNEQLEATSIAINSTQDEIANGETQAAVLNTEVETLESEVATLQEETVSLETEVTSTEVTLASTIENVKPGIGQDSGWETVDLDTNNDGTVNENDIQS